MTEIQAGEGCFYLPGEGGKEPLAVIEYSHGEDGTLVVTSTRVSEQLRGQGTGEKLVQAVVELARETGARVVPQCSYAAHQFKKHPEYGDVLDGEPGQPS